MATRIENQSRFSALSFGLVIVACFFAVTAHSQTYTILHTFTGIPDGETPMLAVLFRNTTGDLYGTTAGGGVMGGGTIFRLDTETNESILHYFNYFTENTPFGGLVVDMQGNAYGTTYVGGTPTCGGISGAVYKLEKSGKYSLLHCFSNTDGYSPTGTLVLDPQGSLFGTTRAGGAHQSGVIYKIDAAGNFRVLHDFRAFTDGAAPGALIRGTGGALYGATQVGGSDYSGTIFRFNPNTGQFAVLHAITPPLEGSVADGRLVADAHGNLYGTTLYGGRLQGGTVFKLSSSGEYSVLYSFSRNGLEGHAPNAGVIIDAAGNLYGSTTIGGAGCSIDQPCGSIFKLDPSGKITILHSFTGADGAYPDAELIRDSAGNLYGTAADEGPSKGYGVVFKISPQ